MNEVCLIGRTTRDIEVRYTQDKTAVARFTVAVNRHDKNNSADFISCVAFGKTAENMEKYVNKGDRIAVNGRIQTGSYKNKNGDTVYTTDVIANHVEFIETKREKTENSQPTADKDGFMQIPDSLSGEELPFT